MGVRGVLTTPYHPESNGTVERVNGTLTNMLRKLAADRTSEWNTFLPAVMFAYNISKHSATGHSPFQLMYGRHPGVPPILYSLLGNPGTTSPAQYLATLANTLIKLQSKAFSEITLQRTRAQAADMSRRWPLPQFKIGDEVSYCDLRAHGRLQKLNSIWLGPFKIIKPTSTDAYTIKESSTGRLINRVHAKFLQKFHRLPVGNSPKA